MAIFLSPYDNHDERNGTKCTVLGDRYIEHTNLHLLRIRFDDDGFTIEVWPEEVQLESPGHPGESEQSNE